MKNEGGSSSSGGGGSSEAMAAAAAELEASGNMEEVQNRLINEEYKIWKKNTPFLYDLVLTRALEWPSLTVEWIPGVRGVDNKEYNVHRMVLGTHTSDAAQNLLMLADVTLPKPDAEIDARKYDDDKGELGGFGGVHGKVEIKVMINHDGEVNRARHMPQNSFIIATKSPTADVCVFDVSKHPSTPAPNSGTRPEHRCKGHTMEGYGVAWNPHVEGQLLSCAEDGLVCVWDVKEAGAEVNPTYKIQAHSGVAEDVAWHCFSPGMFASCGDDEALFIWDTKKDPTKPAMTVKKAHGAEVNSVAFNPLNQYLLATGGSDKVINLWDLRNMTQPMHALEGHTDEVYQIQWAPFEGSVLASGAADRRVNIWDMSKIGQEQHPDDADDGPPELLFIHGGHTNKVTDLSWNPNEEWMLASVAEDNILQVWQMAENIYLEEEGDEVEEVNDEDLED